MDQGVIMAVFELHSDFSPQGDQPQAIKTLVERFEEGAQFQTLLGVTGSGKTFTMANVITALGKRCLVLAPNKTLAAQLFGELKEFFPNNRVEYFVSYYDYYQPEAYVPGSDTYIEKDSAINEEIDKLRHSATRSLLEHDDVIVVASVSCIYGIGSPQEYGSQKIIAFEGDKIKQSDFVKSLIEVQYQRNDLDFARGNFRMRGDTVEIFPSYEDEVAIRVEFFDDEIESISLIDPMRGLVHRKVNSIVIYPSSHYVVSKENLKRAIGDIQVELRSRVKQFEAEGKKLEVARLTQRTLLDLEMMEEMGFCSGIENYSRHLTGSKEGDPPPTLIDFFNKKFIMIVDESHITIPQVGGMYRGDRSRKETLVNYGFRLPSALDNRPLSFDEFEGKYDQVLFVSATPGDYELKKTQGEFVEQIIRPTGLLDPVVEVHPAHNQVKDFLEEARAVIAKGFRVLVTTLTKKLAEDLTKYYEGLGMKVKYLHSDIDSLERIEILRDLRLGEFDILVGINLLREGLDLPEVALVGVMDADREGFLRSTRSLVQIIGRAARNSQGRVILYAYTETKSIKEAIAVSNGRREKQTEYNRLHGITPTTISKKVFSSMTEMLSPKGEERKSLTAFNPEEFSSVEELDEHITDLKTQMRQAAKDLEFEKAAKIRDEIKNLGKIRIMFL